MLFALLAALLGLSASAADAPNAPDEAAYADRHAARGAKYFDERDYARAAQELRQAAASSPDDPALNVMLCRALERVNDLAAADNQCRRALVLSPESDEAHGALGNVLVKEGAEPSAVAEYRLCLQYNDKAPGVRANLGYLLDRMKRYVEADRECRRAVVDEPDNDLAFGCLGISFFERGRPADAVAPLRRAVALNPKRRNLAMRLAAALSATGRDEEALKLYRAGMDEGYEGAYYGCGKLLAKQGKRREAAEILKKFLDMTSKSEHYGDDRADARKILDRLGARP